MRKHKPVLAIVFALGAACVYAFLALMVKITEKQVPNEMVVFFRQLFSLLTISAIFPFKKVSFKSLKTEKFPLHLLRAFCSLSAMYCLYYAIKHIALVDAILLSYTRPLFIPIVVYLWFRKKWTKSTWIGLLLGFAGILFILKPGQMQFNIAAIIALASGMFGGIAFTIIRRLTKTEPADRIVFYYLAISMPIAVVPMLPTLMTPSPYMWGMLVLVGLGGAAYQMLLTRAYQYAKAYKVGSLLFSSVIFAAILDYFWNGTIIGYVSVIGVILICIGSYIAMKESNIQEMKG